MDRGTVVITLVGESAALAGLVLVYVGAIVTALSMFAPDTIRTVKGKYAKAARWLLGLLTIGLAAVAGGTVWMISGGAFWYHMTVVCALVQVIGLAAAAWIATERVLLP